MGVAFAADQKPKPTPMPSSSPTATPTASPAATPSPGATATPQPTPTTPTGRKIKPKERKQLLKAFKRAQQSQVVALRHTHKTEWKQLNQSIKARRKEHIRKNKKMKRKERRKLRKDFEHGARMELKKAKSRHMQAIKGLRMKQKQDAKQFKMVIDQGLEPGPTLWPDSP